MVTSVIRISFLHIKIYEKISGECSHCCWINKLWTFDHWTSSKSIGVAFFLHFALSFTDRNLIQIIHPLLESLPDQIGQKRIDAVTRKNTEFIWRRKNNQDKVSGLLKFTLSWQTILNLWGKEEERWNRGFAAFLAVILTMTIKYVLIASSALP